MIKYYDVVNYCEINESAAKAYSLLHNVAVDKNLVDVTKADFTQFKDITFLFGGSPCQDFSFAGKLEGAVWTCTHCGYQYNPLFYNIKERHKCPQCGNIVTEYTRSSLIQYFIEAVLQIRPKVAIYENVSSLLCKRYSYLFKQFQFDLESAGYYFEVLHMNCEDYNIPQHRERVFVVFMRKDVAISFINNLQKPNITHKSCLKDYLDFEDTTHMHVSELVASRFKFTDTTFTKMFCGTVLGEQNTRFGVRDKVCHENGSVCTLTATDYKQPRIVLTNLWKYKDVDVTNCKVETNDLLKITPKEALRLMGFKDRDYQKLIESGIRKNTIYSLAGNSIAVNVLFYLFKAIYMSNADIFKNIRVVSLFSGIGAFERALTMFLECLVKEKNINDVEFQFDFTK